MRTHSFALTITLFVPAAACGDDGTATTAATTETGDGDGDSTDDEGPSTGDGDGDGDDDSPCAWRWEAVQMKANGQTHAAFDVAVADDGKLAVVGKIENADDDAWVALLEPSGEIVWEQTIASGSGPDAATAVTFDQAGDLVLVGRQASANHQVLWIEKRGATNGAVLWTVTEVSQFDGDNEPGDIALAPDGSLVVSGTIRAGDQDADLWVRKLASSDGSEQWTSSFSGTADANGFSIDRGGPLAVASDGSIYVGGTEGVNFETREGVLLRFGPDGGAPQWKASPHASGSPHLHEVRAVAAGPDGEAYAAFYQGGTPWSFWLERISASGDVEWTLTQQDFVYAPTDEWLIAGLAIAQDGTLTIGGRLTNEEVGQAITWSEAWIANVSLDGVGQCIEAHTWQNTHIIPARTLGYGLAEGPNGAVMVGEVIDGPENYLWVGGFE